MTCTGVIAGTGPFITNGGISVGAPYSILNVNSLSGNIAPTVAGVGGVRFRASAGGTATIDTGDFRIVTTAAAADRNLRPRRTLAS